MSIKVGTKEVELKFTYNSFKYMEDLDVTVFEDLDGKPFKMLSTVEMMLMGACNNDPKNIFTVDAVQEYLESTLEDGTFLPLVETLMNKLETSNFFLALQKTEPKTKKK